MRAEKKDRAEADCRGEELARKGGETRRWKWRSRRSAKRKEREREKKRKENAVSVRREEPLKALKRVLDDRM